MPRLLYSYLLSEITAPFLGSLVVLTGALFLGQLLQSFDLVFTLGIGLADFVRLTLYLLPKMMMFSLPLAGMLGVILAFNRLGVDNEFLALRAAGVRLRQIITPVAIFALAVSLMAGYSTTVLMPRGLLSLEGLMLKLAREKIDRSVQARSFSDSLAGIVAYVDHIDMEDGHWHGVYLYDGRDPKRPMTVTARRAKLAADYGQLTLNLRLEDGAIDYLDQELSRHITFKTYSLNLPVILPAGGVQKGAEKPTEMTQSELLAASREAGDTIKGREMRIEYHQRLILSVGCFILTLLGLPFAARSRPGARPVAVPVGLLVFLCYYLLYSLAETLAREGFKPLPLALWVPNGIFLALAVGLVARMDRESLLPGLDRLAGLWPKGRD